MLWVQIWVWLLIFTENGRCFKCPYRLQKEPDLWLPFFIADKNLVEVWGVFIQDGVPHVQQQAPVNLNQVLHHGTKTPGAWTQPLITLLFPGSRGSRGRTYRNVDEDPVDFGGGDEFLQRVQEILKRGENVRGKSDPALWGWEQGPKPTTMEWQGPEFRIRNSLIFSFNQTCNSFECILWFSRLWMTMRDSHVIYFHSFF